MRSYRPLAILITSLAIAACGQKGPLVRPDRRPPTSPTAPAAPPTPATDSTTALPR